MFLSDPVTSLAVNHCIYCSYSVEYEPFEGDTGFHSPLNLNTQHTAGAQ